MSAPLIAPPIPPLTLGACATLACIWEATAPKPGNVYRGADFEDLTYADFLTSAAVIGPVIDWVREAGVGATVLAGVEATKAAVATNSNLGMLLLMAPLAAATPDPRQGIAAVLNRLDANDTRRVYAAIRAANPGGLGKLDTADVHAEPPALGLKEVMGLAADRDLIARQYVDDFAEVFWTADQIAAAACSRPLADAIVNGYIDLVAEHPDSLMARKCGTELARTASEMARSTVAARACGESAYHDALAQLDFWLRADGHRRNPGTSADIVAAALFVLLREQRISWPVRFYSFT
jgi:triphosphoribosyl-dephospho-CoA synthase